MKNFSKQLLLINLLAIGSLFATTSDRACKQNDCFEHNILLQLADANGFLVENTEFFVTLDVLKRGPLVTVQWPTVNFQTGQYSSSNTADPVAPAGGYIYTVDDVLPENVRPVDLVPRTVLGASNNGLSPVFSFTQTPSSLPVPPVGYQVQITNAGEFQIVGAGTFNNTIEPGPQILMPGSITYVAKKTQKLCKNVVVSNGATSTVNFTAAANNGVRDSHVCDAFDNVVAFAWCDNSNIPQDINTLNLMVAIGTVDANGNLQMRTPVQITDFPENVEAWDTAIAINRLDSSNIVVSYGTVDFTETQSVGGKLCRAVSFDGGQTFGGVFNGTNVLEFNGPLAEQPIGEYGDARGVGADKLGNFWYNATVTGAHNAPIFYVSENEGIDFTLVFTSPVIGDFDYPQYCFGTDNTGQYGLYYVSAFGPNESADKLLEIGFLPIPGDVVAPTVTLLPNLINSIEFPTITAADDGRVWLLGNPNTNGTPISPLVVSFKSTGSLDENYAGVWDVASANFFDNLYTSDIQPSGVVSQPVDGFILASAQSIIYDDARKALYALCAAQVPNKSQNMRLFLTISVDNGMTWSNPININTTDFANRGFQSMALDSVTGNLVFGWYDGRNDDTFESLEYYAAVIPAATLDRLVHALPASNPTFVVPPTVG